jgi:hypothetical protein
MRQKNVSNARFPTPGSQRQVPNVHDGRPLTFFQSNPMAARRLTNMQKIAASTGLPDFSWRNIPKLGKLYPKRPQNIPNDHRI